MATRSKTKGETSKRPGVNPIHLVGGLDDVELHDDLGSASGIEGTCAINPPGDLPVVHTPKSGMLSRLGGIPAVRTPKSSGDFPVRASKPSTPDRPIWVPVLNPHPVLSPRISPARSVISARATKSPITKPTTGAPAAIPRKRGRPRKSQTQLTRKPVSKKVATKSITKTQNLKVTTDNNGDPAKPATPSQSAISRNGGKSSGVDSHGEQPIPPYVWVRDCTIGKGRTAQPGNQVSIRFKGRVDDSKRIVYDENVKGKPVRIFSTSEPPKLTSILCVKLTFVIGSTGPEIPSGKSVYQGLGKGLMCRSGLSQGLTGMAISGTRLIYIPPSFGFGSEQHGVVPPNSRLVIGNCNAFRASGVLLMKIRHARMPS